MPVNYPVFQPLQVINFGVKPQGQVPGSSGPGPGTYVNFHPRIFQPITYIRFGFYPRGAVAGGGTGPGPGTSVRYYPPLFQNPIRMFRFGPLLGKWSQGNVVGGVTPPPPTETNISGGIHLYRVYRRRRGRHDYDDEETPDERRSRIFALMSEHLDEIEIKPKPKRAERKAQNKAIRRIELIAQEAIEEDRGFAPQYAEFAAALAALREASRTADRMLANHLAMSVANRLLSDVVGRMERLRMHNEHAISVLLLSE